MNTISPAGDFISILPGSEQFDNLNHGAGGLLFFLTAREPV